MLNKQEKHESASKLMKTASIAGILFGLLLLALGVSNVVNGTPVQDPFGNGARRLLTTDETPGQAEPAAAIKKKHPMISHQKLMALPRGVLFLEDGYLGHDRDPDNFKTEYDLVPEKSKALHFRVRKSSTGNTKGKYLIYLEEDHTQLTAKKSGEGKEDKWWVLTKETGDSDTFTVNVKSMCNLHNCDISSTSKTATFLFGQPKLPTKEAETAPELPVAETQEQGASSEGTAIVKAEPELEVEPAKEPETREEPVTNETATEPKEAAAIEQQEETGGEVAPDQQEIQIGAAMSVDEEPVVVEEENPTVPGDSYTDTIPLGTEPENVGEEPVPMEVDDSEGKPTKDAMETDSDTTSDTSEQTVLGKAKKLKKRKKTGSKPAAKQPWNAGTNVRTPLW